MLSREPRSPANTASAPVAAMSVTILSEMSGYLTQLPATSAPLFVKDWRLRLCAQARMDQEQTIDIPQFRVWESGDNRVAKADRQRSPASAGSRSNRLSYLFILCSRQGPEFRSIRRAYFAACAYHRSRSSFNPRGGRGRRGPRPRSRGWLRASELPRRADRRNSVAHAGENLGDMTYFDQPALPV
jgi:hypothetical protein